MREWLKRQQWVLGERACEILGRATVAVVGIGGVGCAAAEGLCRAGVGRLILMDFDTVDVTNKNRQLVALTSTIGQNKAEAMAARLRDINPGAEVIVLAERFELLTADRLFSRKPDAIVDAIDIVTNKLDLIEQAVKRGIFSISAMGTGNKLDPSKLTIADLSKTSVCPLARVLRRELKARGITHARCLYSTEEPRKQLDGEESHGRHSPGSLSWVPPVAGFLMAGDVVLQILKNNGMDV